MTLVEEYGFSWPRNKKNLQQIKKLLRGKKGVYVLSHGAMPMYVGKGKIASRVRGHAKKTSSKSRFSLRGTKGSRRNMGDRRRTR
jgi:hypothetical protein